LPDGEINRFRTFPSSSDSFNFVVIGDTRTDSLSHQKVIDRIAHYDFAFMIHSGDFVTRGYNTDDWRMFFNIEGKVISKKLFLPAIHFFYCRDWKIFIRLDLAMFVLYALIPKWN
jgi:hypothetical protein